MKLLQDGRAARQDWLTTRISQKLSVQEQEKLQAVIELLTRLVEIEPAASCFLPTSTEYAGRIMPLTILDPNTALIRCDGFLCCANTDLRSALLFFRIAHDRRRILQCQVTDPSSKAIAKSTAEPVNQTPFCRRMAFWRGTAPASAMT